MTLFDFFEQVCMETSIHLDTEIQTVDELKLLIENYKPQTRNYVHVLDSLMQQANATPEIVEPFEDITTSNFKMSSSQEQNDIQSQPDESSSSIFGSITSFLKRNTKVFKIITDTIQIVYVGTLIYNSIVDY